MTRRLLLALVLLVLAGCGGGGGGSADKGFTSTGKVDTTGPATAQTATVDTTDKLVFAPNEVTAKVGKVTLTLTNTGQVPHNLVFDDKSLPAIDTVTAGQSMSQTYTFSQAGTYRFVCTYHPGMVGRVVVSPSA